MLIATCWDDGLITDFVLMSILEKYSVAASFAINIDMHQDRPTLNDHRSVEYGSRVSRGDLIAYNDYDVLNHTATHLQMDSVHLQVAQNDILNGKYRSEQFYSRDVVGIVWPYGISTLDTQKFAIQIGHRFGRTTPTDERAHSCSRWNAVPFASWRIDPARVIDSQIEYLILTGHTYEMKDIADWQMVDELYRTLSSDGRCRLTTLTKLMEQANAE